MRTPRTGSRREQRAQEIKLSRLASLLDSSTARMEALETDLDKLINVREELDDPSLGETGVKRIARLSRSIVQKVAVLRLGTRESA